MIFWRIRKSHRRWSQEAAGRMWNHLIPSSIFNNTMVKASQARSLTLWLKKNRSIKSTETTWKQRFMLRLQWILIKQAITYTWFQSQPRNRKRRAYWAKSTCLRKLRPISRHWSNKWSNMARRSCHIHMENKNWSKNCSSTKIRHWTRYVKPSRKIMIHQQLRISARS